MVAIITIAILIFLLGLFAFFCSANRISKPRLQRAVHRNKRDAKPSDDLPSIARDRYRFLYIQNTNDQFSFFVRTIMLLDDLLVASGLKWRITSLFIVICLVCFKTSLLIHFFINISIIFTLIISLPLSVFLTLKFLIYRKSRQLSGFQAVFPDALDLIVRSVRAGLPVTEAIKMIGTEIAEPVSGAFREVGANLSIGMSLDEALASLQKKIPLPEVKFFAISLTIQQETGGNLAEILANLSAIMRKRVQIGKKIRALSSEARASALIIGSLPFIVGLAIYTFNRPYIETLFVDPTGQVFLAGALGSIALGAIVMARLVRFEI